jgi:hypothetical protein
MRQHRGFLFLLPIYLASLAADNSFAVSPVIDPTYTNDHGPSPIGDRVNPPRDSVDFYYLSDAEDPALPPQQSQSEPLVTSGSADVSSLPWIVTWVRNIHPKPLRFAWDAYDMYRASGQQPLQAGRPDKYTFQVCDYYVDSDTEIRFTHVGLPLRAPSYKATTTSGLPECKAEANSSIRSLIESGYIDEAGGTQHIDFEITSTFDGHDVIFEIDYNKNDISFALSGLWAALESLPHTGTAAVLAEDIRDQLASSGALSEMGTLADMLTAQDNQDLPSDVVQTDFLQISLDKAEEDGSVRFAIPTKEFTEVVQTSEKIAFFDSKGNLISVGPIGIYMPRS